MGNAPARPCPCSPQVTAFGKHQEQGAADSFTEKGVRALWGTVVEVVTLPSGVV